MWYPTAARCVYNTFVRVLSFSLSLFPPSSKCLEHSTNRFFLAPRSKRVAEDALHRFTPLYVTPRGRYTRKRIIPFMRARREYAKKSFHLEARQVLVAPLFHTTYASSPRGTKRRCSSPAVGDTVDPPPGATHGASHMALFL